jgi:hypothetical protein
MGKIMHYVAAGLVGTTLGTWTMRLITNYTRSPERIIYTDVHEDTMPDIVVESQMGGRFTFLQQEDGTFKKLSNIQKEKTESIEEKVNVLE